MKYVLSLVILFSLACGSPKSIPEVFETIERTVLDSSGMVLKYSTSNCTENCNGYYAYFSKDSDFTAVHYSSKGIERFASSSDKVLDAIAYLDSAAQQHQNCATGTSLVTCAITLPDTSYNLTYCKSTLDGIKLFEGMVR